jgi:hypothetical protein
LSVGISVPAFLRIAGYHEQRNEKCQQISVHNEKVINVRADANAIPSSKISTFGQ